jgi:hypothetical protein
MLRREVVGLNKLLIKRLLSAESQSQVFPAYVFRLPKTLGTHAVKPCGLGK